MKSIVSILALVLMCGVAQASVTGKVVSIQKAILQGKPAVEVSLKFTLPDGTVKPYTMRYSYNRFSKEQIDKDIKEHCETMIEYYLVGNRDKVLEAEEDVVDALIAAEDLLASKDKVVNIEQTYTDYTITDLGLVLDAEGDTVENFK